MIRYLVLVLTIFLLALNLSAILCLPATYPALIGSKSTNSTDLKDLRFNFQPIQKTMLFASTFGGMFFAVIPFCELMRKFKCHRVLTITSSLSTVFLLITPSVLAWSFPCYIVIRTIQSMITSKLFIVAGFVVNEWAPKTERGLFVAVLSSIEVSSLFTMPVSGIVSENFGWPSNFYFHAFCLGLITLLWTLVYQDSVLNHPFLSAHEKYLITDEKEIPTSQTALQKPYREIFTSPAVWAIWVAAVGHFAISQFNFNYSPIYVKNVMNVELSEAGRIILLPTIVLVFFRALTGYLSDSITSLKESTKIRIFNSIAFFGSAFFLIIIYFFPQGNPNHKIRDIILFTLTTSLCGFASGGLFKSTVLVAGQYSSFIFAILQMMGCVTGVPGAVIIPALTPNDTSEQWNNVFLIYALILIGTNVVFLIFARSSPADWSTINVQHKININMTNKVHREKIVNIQASHPTSFNQELEKIK